MPSESATFEHFEIIRRPDGSLYELGRGAMGVTYKAFDTRLGSHVALKVINAEAIKTEVGRLRFEREAKAAAHLNHPNVAAIFHRGQDGGTYFYAMQFIEGETFNAFVQRRGPLPAALALRLILQAAQGLSAASARGLIHRDIKPANLMLVGPEDADGDDEELLVKVIDFGLAKYLNKPDDAAAAASLTGDRLVGTPYYMSPEQIDPVGKEIDARADIYSLGVTLWHLLTGQPPYRGSEFQVLSQHMNGSLPWEQLPATVPAHIQDLLERMMAKDPARRPASHRELIGLLKQQLRTLAAEGNATGAAAPRPGAPERGPRQEVVEQSSGLPLPPDFSLADVLQRRGRLAVSEVLGLLSLLAPVVDAKREQEAQAYDLTPARIFVRFDSPPSNLADLLAHPVDAWPASQLEIVTLAGQGAAAETQHPARPLASLAYELLAGRPAGMPYAPLAAVSQRGNAVLCQVLDSTDTFGSAVRFADAFRLTLAGELHVPMLPAPTGASTDWSPGMSDYRAPGARRPAAGRRTLRTVGLMTGLLCLAGAAAWWQYAGRANMRNPTPALAALYARLRPAPAPAGVAVGGPPRAVPGPGAGIPDPGSITTAAMRRHAPAPAYPAAARTAHQQGRVLLDVDVDAAGNVTAVALARSCGFPLLDEAAMQAVRQWKFDPARRNGAAMPSRTEQPVDFRLPGP